MCNFLQTDETIIDSMQNSDDDTISFEISLHMSSIAFTIRDLNHKIKILSPCCNAPENKQFSRSITMLVLCPLELYLRAPTINEKL